MIILLHGVYAFPLNCTTYLLCSLLVNKALWLLKLKLVSIFPFAFPTSRHYCDRNTEILENLRSLKIVS